jgi:predicted dinucleotide-binding enzyme
MRIGIIGAGQIGGNLARRLTTLGHEVSIANSRGPESLAGLAKETGAKPVTVRQAARGGDVVIVTIPMKNIPQLAGIFEGVPNHVVVVDTGEAEGHSRTHCPAGSGRRPPGQGGRHPAAGPARLRRGGRRQPGRVLAAAAEYTGVRHRP